MVACVNERKLAFAATLISSLSLGACVTPGDSSIMDARAEAPQSPKTTVYLPV